MISMITVFAAVCLPAFIVCLRQVLRYMIERERWRSTERLADRYGIAALTLLPELARELREHDASGAYRQKLPAAHRRMEERPVGHGSRGDARPARRSSRTSGPARTDRREQRDRWPSASTRPTVS